MPRIMPERFRHAAIVGKYQARGIRPALEELAHFLVGLGLEVSFERETAMAAARQFTRGDHRHRVVIGKDTRLSGYMLEPALTAGFISMGMDVALLGPLPTPAIAMLTRSLRADLGVMISALVGKSGAGIYAVNSSKLRVGFFNSAIQAVVTSRKLCGGMSVAIPTAIPDEPLTKRLGTRDGITTGANSVSS